MSAQEIIDAFRMDVPHGYTSTSWKLLIQDYVRLHGAVAALNATYCLSTPDGDVDDRTELARKVVADQFTRVWFEVVKALNNQRFFQTLASRGLISPKNSQEQSDIHDLYKALYEDLVFLTTSP